jgi:peroxiredoxin
MGTNPTELDSRPQSRREWSGYLRSLVLPLALLTVIVGALFWLQARRDSGAASDGFGTVELPPAKNATSKSPDASVGRAAPDFLLRGPDGVTLRLSDLQGRPVIVNFWATWCPTCRSEMPDVVKTYDAQRATGLQIVGVNLRESDGRVADYAREHGASFPMVVDRSGEVARTWRIGGPNQGVPSTYFIDSTGVVRKVIFGLLTPKNISEGLDIIGATPPAKAGA